ncbi:MAG: amino acid adenylation domain-containing protein [Nostoc sp.]|uniref:non-ribosomal peptide synthetase n=1 Tax=Nostoc sp. TaxID=1180 RepID=UPI002FFCDBD6
MGNFYQQLAALSPEQRVVLEKRLKQRGLSPLTNPEISKIEISKRKDYNELPLSFAQQRLWFFQQLNPDNSAYNGMSALSLKGQLNVALLEKVFTEIVRRHESLRTTFITNSQGQPIQVIASSQPIILPIIDLQGAPNQQEEVQRLASVQVQQPFDLTKPLLRITLLKLTQTEYVLFLIMHHIISDRWSDGVFVREMKVLYEAFANEQPSPLAELPIQYADWAIWQQQYLQGEVLATQIAYWKKQLAHLAVLELPTDRPRPSVPTYQGAIQSFELSKTLSDALKAMSAKEGVTLFMLLVAVFKVLLHKYTNQSDIVVGTDIANRNRVETEGLIGFLINTLVLRTDLSGNPSFRSLLHRVREVTLGAYDHQDLSFDKLVDILNPERNLAQMVPLLQVKFDLQLARVEPLELSNLTVSPLTFNNGTAKFELRFNLVETERGLTGKVEYSTDLFDIATIMWMVEHFQTLLEEIVVHPEYRLSELSLLTPTEQHKLLVEWNNTEVEYPQTCIHQLFATQVKRTPEAVAVVCENEQLTYKELNARANQLAHHLQKLGVGTEVLVGICVERSSKTLPKASLHTIVGLLGILKAGGAYVPLDPVYPQERLAFMLQDAQVPIILTQQHLVEKLPEHQAQVVCLDIDWDNIAQNSPENPIVNSQASDLAYIIYTSGSTGKPKGVCGSHQGAINRFHWMWQTYPFTSEDICCQKTSLNFVDSVWEIFGALLQGVKTVIIPDRVVKAPKEFVTTLANNHVTRLLVVPSLLRVLLDTYSDLQLRLPKLKLWVTSGEALSIELLQQFRQNLPTCTLLNLYGSSEVAADVSCYCIEPQTPIPLRVAIGRAIANTKIYVLDPYLQPVPMGVPGELYISGAGLARGYLNQPEMTKERFIANPFANAKEDQSWNCDRKACTKYSRLYKTGDLARYLPDGNIEFLGRIDDQVKIRGFRVELGEIEAVLGQHPGVQEAVVICREDEPGNQQLVAYIVSHLQQTLSVSELNRLLKEKLPDYMMPKSFVMLEALPLLPNGKINRRGLPLPDQVRPELAATYQLPQTEIEQSIANIWQEVLHIEDVGINDNFFELGGHSLLLVQVHNKLQKIFQQEFPLFEMFHYPTISYLAQYLSQQSSEQQSLAEPSHRPESRQASIHRRKQVRQQYRAVTKPKDT